MLVECIFPLPVNHALVGFRRAVYDSGTCEQSILWLSHLPCTKPILDQILQTGKHLTFRGNDLTLFLDSSRRLGTKVFSLAFVPADTIVHLAF
jgi:hypothetical protein